MQKVYAVWYDNCEEYEDNFVDVDAIFSTKEKAEQYIFNKGFIRKEVTKRLGPNGMIETYIAYFLPKDEEDYFFHPALSIEEFELDRTDNIDYNEEGIGV